MEVKRKTLILNLLSLHIPKDLTHLIFDYLPCEMWKNLQSMMNECKGYYAIFSTREEFWVKKGAHTLFIWTDASKWELFHAFIVELKREPAKRCVIWDVPTLPPLLNPSWGYVFDTSSISEQCQCQLRFYSRFTLPFENQSQ